MSSATVALAPPRIPVEAGVPKRVERVSQGIILYPSPAPMPNCERLEFAKSSELIVTVVAVLLTVVEIRNIAPSAAPEVIWIK